MKCHCTLLGILQFSLHLEFFFLNNTWLPPHPLLPGKGSKILFFLLNAFSMNPLHQLLNFLTQLRLMLIRDFLDAIKLL